MLGNLNILGVIVLIVTILLLIKFYRNIFIEFSGYILVLLGYAVFIFIDDFRYNILGFDYRVLKSDTAVIISFLNLMSFAVFWASYHLFQKKKKKFIKSEDFAVKKTFDRVIVPLSIIYPIFYKIFLLEYQITYLDFLSFISKATILISFYLFLKFNKKKYLVYTIILLLVSFYESSRRVYLTVFIVLFILLITKLNEKKLFKSSYKFALIISAVIFFIFLNALRSEHDFGKGFVPDNQIANTLTYIKDLRLADTFYNAGFVYETFPERFNFYYGRTYLTPIFGIIPRSFWPDKPTNFGIELGFMERTNFELRNINEWYEINRFSLSPGLIGEALANFGTYGVFIIAILLGLFTKYLDNSFRTIFIFRDIDYLGYLLIFPALLLIFRGDFYSALLFPIYIFIFMKIILFFSIRKLKYEKS